MREIHTVGTSHTGSICWQTLSRRPRRATTLTTDEMKAKVRSHFEDFVNNRKAEVIRTNMTPDFYDHDGPGGQPTDVSGDEQRKRQMSEKVRCPNPASKGLSVEGKKVFCPMQRDSTEPETGKKM